jgi:hypothetical protein
MADKIKARILVLIWDKIRDLEEMGVDIPITKGLAPRGCFLPKIFQSEWVIRVVTMGTLDLIRREIL